MVLRYRRHDAWRRKRTFRACRVSMRSLTTQALVIVALIKEVCVCGCVCLPMCVWVCVQVIETFYGYDEEASVDSEGSTLSFHTDRTPDTESEEVNDLHTYIHTYTHTVRSPGL